MTHTIHSFNFSGKRVLVRVDFNVPLNDDYQITDDTRIRATLPTVQKILKDGGSVVLMSHLGRPKGGYEKKYSLKHLVGHLSGLLKQSVVFAEDCVGDIPLKIVRSMPAKTVVLLENLRFHKEEEKGDEQFAKQLSDLGDIYVNDAFGTAHRAHASTAVIAKFFPGKKFFGYLMEAEIRNIDAVLLHASKPFTAIIGGAKVSSKISVLNNLMNRADNIVIGGGMAYTFAKALGGKIGKSLVEDDRLNEAFQILEQAKSKGVNFFLPVDTVVADAFDNNANRKICSISEIPEGWMGLDIGTKAYEDFEQVILSSKTILWNGPMGVFEMSNFENGTKQIAHAIARATQKGSFSLVGGGDSVAAVNQYQLSDKVSYVSTGGGAMLEYLEGIELPGIKAINQ